MNEKFFDLPDEKQTKIINAGFEVFSQNDFKHASTEDIAAKAGISKGLLFYYFHDKKSLYMFLYDYAAKQLTDTVMDEQFQQITDVFDMFEYAAERKYAVLDKNPYMTDFVVRGFVSEKEIVSEELNKRMAQITTDIYTNYFSKLDYSKFKPEINPFDILHMLTWMADGYLREQQRLGALINLDDLMDKYKVWSDLFKKISYKEEFLK